MNSHFATFRLIELALFLRGGPGPRLPAGVDVEAEGATLEPQDDVLAELFSKAKVVVDEAPWLRGGSRSALLLLSCAVFGVH